ncbi:hypothetical protein GALMADRAFT_145273 [Galerina marginata CBS 339.88]|nr:hypothetical protein GALMADRAFT_145273 [Galerina marginata CBS 339.88]
MTGPEPLDCMELLGKTEIEGSFEELGYQRVVLESGGASTNWRQCEYALRGIPDAGRLIYKDQLIGSVVFGDEDLLDQHLTDVGVLATRLLSTIVAERRLAVEMAVERGVTSLNIED